ncbi:MAG: S8 family serine peptidase [Opitutaceae bacterium]|jgi:subtilisin-like proprotein convertase family protein
MRPIPSSLKRFAALAIVAAAGIWFGAPLIRDDLHSSRTTQVSLTTGATADTPSTNAIGTSAANSIASTVAPTPSETELKQTPSPRIDPATLPADTVWTIRDGRHSRTYAIALNELYMPCGAIDQRLRTLPPQPDLASLLAAARQLTESTGTQPQLVLYPLNGPHDESTRHIVTMKVQIETTDLAAVTAAASAQGLDEWTTPSYAPGRAIAQVSGDPSAPLRVAAFLAKLNNVTASVPLLASQRSKRAVVYPTDTLFTSQWHLRNTGQQGGIAGVDINVAPVWSSYKGTGINIGIVDDGLQLTHPDLVGNISETNNYDWNDNDNDPSPNIRSDFHGTSVAGLAAAPDNGFGVVGAAPGATLYGLRLIADYTTDDQEAQAMSWKNDVIQIKNNSWGPSDYTPSYLGDSGSGWKLAVTDGTTNGREGLGTIYVFAAGNGKAYGDQGNKDGYANDIHVIAIGAVSNKGVSASFSEGGAHLIVSSPGESTPGIVTTDLAGANGYNKNSANGELSDTNYTNMFGGTSAATPIVSGVIALMLEANPELGWRDVQEILLRSSTQLQPTDTAWVTRDGGQPDLPLIKHHPFFGGGLVNAQAAVDLASNWPPLGTETMVTKSSTTTGQDIPDNGAAVTIQLNPGTTPVLRVEHVELTLNVVHSYRGDLEITLTSPSGTVSTLATSTTRDYGEDYDNWTFSSVRHWGESSKGNWTLSIRDKLARNTGHFVSATMNIYGVVVLPPSVTTQPSDAVAAQGTDVSLTTAAVGDNLTYQWSRNGKAVTGATNPTLNLSSITLAQAGTYTCAISNLGGSSITNSAKVVVYNPDAQTQAVNPGTTFTALTIAAGPIDTFQWLLNDSPLANSSRITGATTGTLVVGNVSTADNGTYSLLAMFNSSPLPTGTISFAVRTPPDASVSGPINVRVGTNVTTTLTSTGGPYTYRYTGLPRGLSYDQTTGVITGRSVASGTYPIGITVTDAYGLVTSLSSTLVIDPLPAALVGTFNGIIERDIDLNQNLGGALSFTTTDTGVLSGKVTLGTTALSFTGALDGLIGSDATTTVSIPRTGLDPLVLELTLPLDNGNVTGTLDESLDVIAWHNPWSTTAPASNYTGHYTFALEASGGSPSGFSTGMIDVSSDGTVKWSLIPADGSAALSGSTTLSADGTLTLFAPLKTPSGSFLGLLTLPVSSMPFESLTGYLDWLRSPTSSTAYSNAEGFGPLELTPYGGRYSTPAKGVRVLDLPNTNNNAILEFGGEDVDLGAQAGSLESITVTLTNKNKVTTPKSNPTKLKVTINATTGQFSGTFTLTDPNPTNTKKKVKRSAKFSGVLLQTENAGVGSFILPALPGSDAGIQSGAVFFFGTDQ